MENAALPPLFTAVNLHDSFSSAHRGGKVAIAALPPLIAAETLQPRYRRTNTHRNPSRLYVNVTYLLFNLIPTLVHVFGAHF